MRCVYIAPQEKSANLGHTVQNGYVDKEKKENPSSDLSTSKGFFSFSFSSFFYVISQSCIFFFPNYLEEGVGIPLLHASRSRRDTAPVQKARRIILLLDGSQTAEVVGAPDFCGLAVRGTGKFRC
jgi:hypothetical protein